MNNAFFVHKKHKDIIRNSFVVPNFEYAKFRQPTKINDRMNYITQYECLYYIKDKEVYDIKKIKMLF